MGERWVLGGICGIGAEVDLNVVGIEMEVQFEVADDVAKREQITDEEEGAKDRALGDALCDRGEG